MALWFAGGSCLAVWLVFGDPAMDYRLLVVGALLPDVVDGLWGGARLLHTLVFSVVLLLLVVLATRRGQARRRLLAVPIGTFMHLVLDGMWTRAAVFWWPFMGWSLGRGRLPSLDRPGVVLVAQELAGAAALWWFLGQRRARLDPGDSAAPERGSC